MSGRVDEVNDVPKNVERSFVSVRCSKSRSEDKSYGAVCGETLLAGRAGDTSEKVNTKTKT